MQGEGGAAVIKVAALGIILVLTALAFKNGKSEFAVCIVLCGSILLFLLAVSKLEPMLLLMKELYEYVNIGDSYWKLLLKIVGIAYLSEFASGICKDAGYGAVAGQIALVGKLTILSLSMPVLLALFETVKEFGI